MKRKIPWGILFLLIVAMLLYVFYTNNSKNDRLGNLIVAILSVFIGVFLSAILILWQRSIAISDAKSAKLQELHNLTPTLILETDINIMHLEALKDFLAHNPQSYKSVWERLLAITEQFLNSGYESIRDSRLLNELSGATKSAQISYSRLKQVSGITKEGLAIWSYDSEMHRGDRKDGDEQLSTLSVIADICTKEMKTLQDLLEKEFPEDKIR